MQFYCREFTADLSQFTPITFAVAIEDNHSGALAQAQDLEQVLARHRIKIEQLIAGKGSGLIDTWYSHTESSVSRGLRGGYRRWRSLPSAESHPH